MRDTELPSYAGGDTYATSNLHFNIFVTSDGKRCPVPCLRRQELRKRLAVKVFDDAYSSDLSDVAFFVCRHFVCFTALACSDRLKQIFLIVPALPLFGEPDEAWRD